MQRRQDFLIQRLRAMGLSLSAFALGLVALYFLTFLGSSLEEWGVPSGVLAILESLDAKGCLGMAFLFGFMGLFCLSAAYRRRAFPS